MLQKIYLQIKIEKFDGKGLISSLKNGFKSFSNIVKHSIDKNQFNFNPDINIIKLIFEAIENKLIPTPLPDGRDRCKFNEILYYSLKNLDNFKIYNEKEGLKKSQTIKNNFVKIRILTNQIIKINYEHQNLYEKPIKKNKMKEINFFGLLLKVSKEFLTPSYNVIIHLNGGGFYSQSSESHLNYLSE